MKQHLISDILFGPALVLGGSGLADAEAIKASGEEFAGQRFCIVRQWLLLDVLLPEGFDFSPATEGLATTVLFAQRVVHDSATQLVVGKPFLSGFQQRFVDCFFETEQGLFVLAGSGARKSISLPALIALEEAMGYAYESRLLANRSGIGGVQMCSVGHSVL